LTGTGDLARVWAAVTPATPTAFLLLAHERVEMTHGTTQPGQDVLAAARGLGEWITGLRRRLHAIPELGYQEHKTSQLIRETLTELGIAWQGPIAETGVVATLSGGPGPCVALRADIDALPIEEQAEVPFRSQHAGRMHACGHDCHTAMLLGAARLLKAREADLRGTVKLIFQPAEEGLAGAERMCQAGVLQNPRVERIFGLHVWPATPTGQVAGRAGTFLAATGFMHIVVTGVGGHAAMPHLTVDPLCTAAKIVVELQTIISREVDPLQSGVVSVTSFHGGETTNVIPGEVRLSGTMRSQTLPGLLFLQRRIRELVEGIAAVHRCRATVEFPGSNFPATVNTPALWELAQQIGGDLLGSDAVLESPPVMGGEDFAFYTEQVPGCFVGLGIRNEELGSTWGLHHPRFLVDEAALPLGTALHVEFALRSLRELSR